MTTDDGPNGAGHATAHTHVQGAFNFGQFSAQSQSQKRDRRRNAAPAKYPIRNHHLDEFTSREELVSSQQRKTTLGPNGKPLPATTPSTPSSRVPSMGPSGVPRPLKEPLSIKPMRFLNFLSDGVSLYVSNVMHPSQIPGRDLFSRVYAMCVLPVLIIALTIVQWGIGLLVIMVTHTRIGAYYYGIFFDDQIALFDQTDFVDPEGNDEAVRQLANRKPRLTTYFSYHIANLLLIMSSMAYQRDDKLVAEASKILLNIENQTERDQATKLLQESEREIDENARREFGMRFMGISELKTLGGPFAGLFYNDDSIVLVFKGTSVLAFNEYLLDMTFQRVDASEYLYGEVHKGFYESLFPDPVPLNCYEDLTYDKTNPFNTIMETIFETAKIAKHKTGKPVNLWLTGHSLGGALAALTMARLQMIVERTDPLLNEDRDAQGERRSAAQGDDTRRGDGSRTVLQEMLARFSNDPDLLVLRDCYSVASPKVGDSTFAEEFGRNQLRFCLESPFKSTYWRLVADKDVVPRLPPGCSVDPNEPCDRIFPCKYCPKSKSWLKDEQQEDSQAVKQQRPPPKHLHSLLDYQHVGQLVKVYNASRTPKAQPSPFEADLSNRVLRTRKELETWLLSLAKIARVWKAQGQVEDTAANGTSGHHTANGISNGHTPAAGTVTTTTTKITTTTSQAQAQATSTQQIAEDIAKAQALYDIDELSRLRQPHLLERILLRIPSLLSHAPAAYQRNLVRGRFYFTSFPGTAFEERVGQWLDGTQVQTTKTVSVNGVYQDKQQSHGQEQKQVEQKRLNGTVGPDKKVNVDVDVDVDVKRKNKDGSEHLYTNGTHEPVETETTVTQTVAVHPREQ